MLSLLYHLQSGDLPLEHVALETLARYLSALAIGNRGTDESFLRLTKLVSCEQNIGKELGSCPYMRRSC